MAKRKNIQTARFELRCSYEELEQWRHSASVYRLSLSRYIRLLLSKNYQKLPEHRADPALVRQVAAIGNNLNQIAFWCNARKSRQETEPVERGIAEVREALERLLAQGDTPC